ncbi:MAG: DNA-binding protein WhiA [bacterium]
MSFALDVKKEIVNNKKDKKECSAFLFGMLLTSKCEENKISFTTSVKEVGEYFLFLLERLFGKVEYSIETEESNITSNYTYNIIDKEYIISNFFDITNIHSSYKESLKLDKKLLSQCIAGNFIVRGSVNDPLTSSYHLEILCNNYSTATYIQQLINSFDFNAKIAKRRTKLIVYLKEAEKIVDLLRIMGASKSAFTSEDIRIERDFNNSINRVINCEIANEQKTQKAAIEQLRYIQYLEYNYPLEKLDPKLLLVMKVRKDNQESSLVELLEIIKEKYDIVLSKPGLSHRFSKIKELAIEHSKGKTK